MLSRVDSYVCDGMLSRVDSYAQACMCMAYAPAGMCLGAFLQGPKSAVRQNLRFGMNPGHPPMARTTPSAVYRKNRVLHLLRS